MKTHGWLGQRQAKVIGFWLWTLGAISGTTLVTLAMMRASLVSRIERREQLLESLTEDFSSRAETELMEWAKGVRRPSSLSQDGLLVQFEVDPTSHQISKMQSTPMWKHQWPTLELAGSMQRKWAAELTQIQTQPDLGVFHIFRHPDTFEEWVGLVTPGPGPHVGLIATFESFVPILRNQPELAASVRAYFVSNGPNPVILSHTQAPFRGLLAPPVVRRWKEEEGRLPIYDGLDGLPVAARVVKGQLGDLVVEVVSRESIPLWLSAATLRAVSGSFVVVLLLGLGLGLVPVKELTLEELVAEDSVEEEAEDEAVVVSASEKLPTHTVTEQPTVHQIEAMAKIRAAQVLREIENAKERKKEAEAALKPIKPLMDRLSGVRTSEELGYRLVEMAAKVGKCPALFFNFREPMQVAVLQTFYGFPTKTRPPGMSLPLTGEVLQEASGPSDALKAHLGLRSLMTTKLWPAFQFRSWEPWPVRSGGSFAGFLILLDLDTESGDTFAVRQALSELLRKAGQTYEPAPEQRVARTQSGISPETSRRGV